MRQCALLGISRSSLNYRRKVTYPEDLAVMKAMDQQYLSTPFYGSRRMRAWLGRQGQTVNRKRVQRLMRTMGLRLSGISWRRGSVPTPPHDSNRCRWPNWPPGTRSISARSRLGRSPYWRERPVSLMETKTSARRAMRCLSPGSTSRRAGAYVLKADLVKVNIERRRRAEATEEWRKRYDIRAGIEGTNSELKRAHGLGRLRVRGGRRVRLAVYLKALACNFKRMVHARLVEMENTAQRAVGTVPAVAAA